MSAKGVYVGIDLGKQWLDFTIAGGNEIIRFGNHKEGIEAMVPQTEISVRPRSPGLGRHVTKGLQNG